MTRYIVRRLLSLPLLLLGIVSIAFLISHFTQGDPLSSIVSERQMDDPQAVAAAKARWGLDKSLPEQYLIYVGNLLTGDLGTSFRTKQPVSQDLLERLPATLGAGDRGDAVRQHHRHHAWRAGGALPRPRDRPCRAALGADRLVDAGVLVRPHPALHLLRRARLAAGTRPARCAHEPAGGNDRLPHHRRAARRRHGAVLGCAASPDPARAGAGLDGDGHRLAPGARQHARRAEPGLHRRRPGARRGRAARAAQSRPAQRPGADADHHRLHLRLSHHRRGADRDDLLLDRHRLLRGGCGAQPGLPGHHGRDHRRRRGVPAHQPHRPTSPMPSPIRASG